MVVMYDVHLEYCIIYTDNNSLRNVSGVLNKIKYIYLELATIYSEYIFFFLSLKEKKKKVSRK